jgi:hypothetical protein
VRVRFENMFIHRDSMLARLDRLHRCDGLCFTNWVKVNGTTDAEAEMEVILFYGRVRPRSQIFSGKVRTRPIQLINGHPKCIAFTFALQL